MAKKSLGHVELQWTCPNCKTVNPGLVKVCEGCGAPQPEDVEFHQAERQELITDEEKLAKAKAGADIHCGYCGTRNPAGATHCSQCKADLSEGVKRKTGRVVGAFKTGPVQKVACPHCGAENLDTARECVQCGGSLHRRPEAKKGGAVSLAQAAAKPKPKRGLFATIGTGLVAAGAAIYFIFFSTTTMTGAVQNAGWERSVPILEFLPVEYEDYHDEVPSDGEVLSCESRVREVVSEEVPNSEEVCGEPYTVDTGGGAAEVVQDCEYHVYEDYCTYTVLEWTPVDTVTLSGDDYSPVWPSPSITTEQRLGEQSETYTIVFNAEGKTYTYETDDYDLYMQAEIGSTWDLEVSALGAVQSISQ
jgi:ribosomal protein L40E